MRHPSLQSSIRILGLGLVLAALALCAWPAVAAGPATPAGRCTQGDCVNGQGAFVTDDGITFTGTFTNGKLNGQGARLKPDGGKYVGGFKDGLLHGQGTQTWPNGGIYVGEFKDDQKNGQGTYTWHDGTNYVGEFQNGVRSGQGTHTVSDGRKYVGEFKDDTFNGQGTHTWPDGKKYVGEFRNNKFHGQGTHTWPDGKKYVGEFRNNKFHGQGTHTWPDGRKYVGEFQSGKRNGQGTFFWPSGKNYVGEFLNDDSHGLGIETSPDGTVKRGIWANDKFVTPLSEQEYAARTGGAGSALQADPLAAERQRLEEERQRLEAERQRLEQQPQAGGAPARPKAGGPQQRRLALVIGNGAYREGPLKNPVNDARDMASALKSLGFEVILRTDASLAQMESAVDEFWGKLRKGGAGLFYFAGHGVQVQGKNYLVPVDAKLTAEQDAKYKCMDAGLVLGRMENAGNDLNLVILDACRNNPFARSWRSAEQGLAKMDAPKGSFIAYATAPGDVAADGTGRNGIYTEKLLKAIRQRGQPVELVFKRVRDEVMRATGDKQVPWESTSLRGEFYFTNPE